MKKCCQAKVGMNKIRIVLTGKRKNSASFSRDVAFKTLDTINFWINSCDTKASILLSGIGVAFTLLFTSNILEKVFDVTKKVIDNFSGIGAWIGILGILSVLGCIVGTGYIISVIVPRQIFKPKESNVKNENINSLMFYGSIAKMSFSTFCEQINSLCDPNDVIVKDLIFQIHSAAKICAIKTKNLKIGSIVFFVSLFMFVFCFSFGYFSLVYKTSLCT